jgi:DNA-3-methyladenine glycosylase
MTPLSRTALPRDTVLMTRFLIGTILVRRLPECLLTGRIVETEAYLPDDPACHAFAGHTFRNASLFLEPGHAYVYRAYGTSWMLNVSAESQGIGAGVLIRAAETLAGIPLMTPHWTAPTFATMAGCGSRKPIARHPRLVPARASA